jgi:hypothetical protein
MVVLLFEEVVPVLFIVFLARMPAILSLGCVQGLFFLLE